MITVKMPDKAILRRYVLDRKPLIKALRKGAGIIARRARKDLNRGNHVSKAGEVPAKQSGDLRKAVKTQVARKAPGLWSAVFYNKPNADKMFYPAPLFYGRRKGDLVKRSNPLDTEADASEEEIETLLSKAMDEQSL